MLIIYAHPNKKGYCGFILRTAENFLKKNSIEYRLLDLYKMKFSPVMKDSEHYTSKKCKVAPKNKKIQKLIKEERRFIFIYPTWWNNMPAILKGFVDRIFTSGFAFRYEKAMPKSLLKGKALVITTTGVATPIYKMFLGHRSLKVLTKDTLKFCGIKARGISFGNAQHLDYKRKKEISRKTIEEIKNLF